MRGCSSFYLHPSPTLVKMAGIQSHMFLSEPFSEEKCKPPVKKPTIPWWWWWVGRVRVRVNHLFFCQSPSKNLFEDSDIVDLSEEKCEPPIKKPSIPWWWWWWGGGEGLGMRVDSEMSWLEKISEVVAGAAVLDKGPDWSQGVLGNRKSLFRLTK